MTAIIDIGTIEYEPSLRKRWVDAQLTFEWARKYREFPEFVNFFDAEFDDFAERHKGFKPGRLPFGFYETLAGILLCHATGYLPMFTESRFRFSPRKQELVEELFDAKILDVIRDEKEFGLTQAPDLLLYKSDLTDWFFCEVKGLTDSLGDKQERKFKEVTRASGKPIRLLSFQEVPSRWSGLDHHAWIPASI